jgi:hypothetical protein
MSAPLSRSRVVALGWPLQADAVQRFRKSVAEGETASFPRRALVLATFEPKAGGGGHVVFTRPDKPDEEDRIVIEPATIGWTAAAYVTAADYRRPDEAYEALARERLFDLFGLKIDPEPDPRATPRKPGSRNA